MPFFNSARRTQITKRRLLATVGQAVASITSLSSLSQPATIRYQRATADRPGTWGKGTGGNAADFTIDATTGIWSLNANALGDGSLALTKYIPLVFTPSDGTGPVSQTVTLSVATLAPTASVSESIIDDFTGAANATLASLSGWTVSGQSAVNGPVLDGSGYLIGPTGTDLENNVYATLRTPTSSLAGSTLTYRVKAPLSDYKQISLYFGASSIDNGVAMKFQANTVGNGLALSNGVFIRQGGTVGSNLGNVVTPYYANWRSSDASLDVEIKISDDANTATVSFVGNDWTSTGTIDLTGKTLGSKYGFIASGSYDPAMSTGAIVDRITFVKAAVRLTVVDVQVVVPGNTTVYNIHYEGNKPNLLDYRWFDPATNTVVSDWMTGETLTNTGTTSGDIAFRLTAPRGGQLIAHIRPHNDITAEVTAPHATHFLKPVVSKTGMNVPGQNYFYRAGFENDWAKSVEIRSSSQITLPQFDIVGTGDLKTEIGITLSGSSEAFTITASNPATGLHRYECTADTHNTRIINWSGTQPAYLTATRDGQPQDGYTAIAANNFLGVVMRNLDMSTANYGPAVGPVDQPLANAKNYLALPTGANVSVARQAGFIAARQAVDPNFEGLWDVVPMGLTDAQTTQRLIDLRDNSPVGSKKRFEMGNEVWNMGQFAGARRAAMEAWSHGHYGSATFASPNAPLTFVAEIPYLDPAAPQNAPSPITMTTGQCLLVGLGGVGLTAWQALRNVASGTNVVEGADFTRLAVGSSDDAGKKWKCIYGKHFMDIAQTVFGSRYDECELVYMERGSSVILPQLTIAQNYVPGHWDLVKYAGYALYFGLPNEFDFANATVASVKAALWDDFAKRKVGFAQAVLDVYSLGKQWGSYEGMAHANYDRINDTPAYATALSAFMNSQDGADYFAAMAKFTKSLGGISCGYYLVGSSGPGTFALKDNWRDTTSKPYVGFLAGLAAPQLV